MSELAGAVMSAFDIQRPETNNSHLTDVDWLEADLSGSYDSQDWTHLSNDIFKLLLLLQRFLRR